MRSYDLTTTQGRAANAALLANLAPLAYSPFASVSGSRERTALFTRPCRHAKAPANHAYSTSRVSRLRASCKAKPKTDRHTSFQPLERHFSPQ